MNEEKKVNPWAVCHASTGPKKNAKFERCVKKVKAQNEAKSDPYGTPEKIKARNTRAGLQGQPNAIDIRRAKNKASRGIKKSKVMEALTKKINKAAKHDWESKDGANQINNKKVSDGSGSDVTKTDNKYGEYAGNKKASRINRSNVSAMQKYKNRPGKIAQRALVRKVKEAFEKVVSNASPKEKRAEKSAKKPLPNPTKTKDISGEIDPKTGKPYGPGVVGHKGFGESMESDIENAGGSSEEYRKIKAKKDAALAKAVRNTGSRAKVLGRRGGMYKDGKPVANQPNNPHYDPDREPSKKSGYGVNPEDRKQKMSRKDINRSGVGGKPDKERMSLMKDILRKRALQKAGRLQRDVD